MFANEDMLVTSDDSVVIEYIHKLYTLELLRKIHENDVTYGLTYQFGVLSGAAWKDDPVLVKNFQLTHKKELMEFGAYKVKCALTDLVNYVDKLSTCIYADVPLDPQELNSVYQGVENFLRTIVSGRDWLNAYCRNLSKSTYSDLSILERLVMNVFNNFTEKHRDLSIEPIKKRYGPRRGELNNRHVYSNVDKIFTAVGKTISALSENIVNSIYGTNTKRYNDERNVLHVLVTFLSLLIHLRIPNSIHPNSLDRLYDKFIKKNGFGVDEIQHARQFSGCTELEVLVEDCSMLDSIPIVMQNEVNSHENIHRTIIQRDNNNDNGDSLIERYLVTKLLSAPSC